MDLFPNDTEMKEAENSVSEISRSISCLVNNSNISPSGLSSPTLKAMEFSSFTLTLQKGKRTSYCIAGDFTNYLSGAIEISTGNYLFETVYASKNQKVPKDIQGYYIINFDREELRPITAPAYWNLYKSVKK